MTPSWKSPLHVMDPRAVVARVGGRIGVRIDGRVVASAPLMCISEVVLEGPVNVTTQALQSLLGAGVPVVFLRGDGRALGRLEPPGSPHVLLRQLQTARCADPAARLHVSRACVTAKLRNQRVLLRDRTRRSDHADRLRVLAGRLDSLEATASGAEAVEQLRGIEGAGSAAYDHGLRLLVGDAGLRRRDRRGPDVVNALLNYCSALLRESVLGAAVAAGLDPHASFFHQAMRGRPTLAFDLMEEWRPVLLDSTVVALLGLGAVGPHDCEPTSEGPRLSPQARRAAVTRFRQRLERPARRYPRGPERETYGMAIRRQARALRSWINGDRDSYEPFAWR